MNTFSKQKEVPISLFHQGMNFHAYDLLGTKASKRKGVSGVVFRVWAPHATCVSVIGDFNNWDGKADPMEKLNEEGLWECFIPSVKTNDAYQYEIESAEGAILHKNDPYAFSFKAGKSAYCDISRYGWKDEDWLQQRKFRKHLSEPLNIYEVHAPTWKQDEEGKPLGWRKLAEELPVYAAEMGYTHIQLLPVMAHPEKRENGDYDICGLYAVDDCLGTAKDFMYFVNKCHQKDIGILLDWVPGHFPKDEQGLQSFDGSACYEYENDQWSSCIYDFSRAEVHSYLISNAFYWLEKYHIDGLRVDAVSSMLYLDYSGENRWNRQGNAASIDFLKRMNSSILSEYPDVMMFAEEASTWPMVTKPPYAGGLGFHFKWNSGWSYDVLQYMALDPTYRAYNHDKLTFGLMYAFSENFVLPLSHDEVNDEKEPLIQRLPGSPEQKFAGMRALLAYAQAHPGKKLSFMGNEFGDAFGWKEQPLSWDQLDFEPHRKLKRFSRDLNHFYLENKALWEIDNSWDGFQWLVHDDQSQSVLAFRRTAEDGSDLIAVCNFTPAARDAYRIGIPEDKDYTVALSSDELKYGGSGLELPRIIRTEHVPMHGKAYSIVLDLPALSVLYLKPAKAEEQELIIDAVISEEAPKAESAE